MSDVCNSNDVLGLANKVEFEDFPVPNSSKVIRFRNMSGSQRRLWELCTYDIKTGKPKDIDLRSALIAYSACDNEFKPIFNDKDIGKISELPMNLLEPMFAVASKLNGIGNNKDLEKKSESNPESGSSSG